MPTNTLRVYFRRLWQDELRHKVPWARDALVLGAAMVLTPIAVAAALYGRDYVRSVDWKLVKATLLVYALILFGYVAYHIVKAAWKSDVSRQEEIRRKDEIIAQKHAAFTAMVEKKDQEKKAAHLEDVDRYREMENRKEKEREAIERTLGEYTVIWTQLQVRSRSLAIELREYCELNPEPVPPLIAGEDPADFLERQVKLRLPWMEKVRLDYNRKYSDRVIALRDDFAVYGYAKDFRLDAIISGAVLGNDVIMEVADRLMGLALKELAHRQLRTLTLKQLCN